MLCILVTGKAGGFLALDWQDGSPVGPLARASFAMHEHLAGALGEDCGYRRVRTLSVAACATPINGKPPARFRERRRGEVSVVARDALHPPG